MKHNYAAMFVILALLLYPSSLQGGSVVHLHLADLPSLRVKVVTGALRFEPIPSLNIDRLGGLLETRVATILSKGGVGVSRDSRHEVVVVIEHQWGAESKSLVAIAVTLKLVQPSFLPNHCGDVERAAVWVTSWEERRLLLVPPAEAEGRITESVEIAADAFAGAVRAARYYANENSTSKAPPAPK